MLPSMRRFTRQLIAVLASLICAMTPAAVANADTPYHPAGSIEAEYTQPGPYAVTSQLGFGCCDSTGAKYDIWYPTDPGSTRHPILTWGDGTAAVPRQYNYLLRHLASWGFVVIATENQSTHSGADIISAARYLIDRAAVPSSIFHNKLDTHAVGAIGHSQGATGSLNALARSGGLIKTAVPIELPIQALCSPPGSCGEVTQLRGGSVFYVNGSADVLISPSRPSPLSPPGPQSNQQYYDATPAGVTKAWGTLVGPNHNDVQGQPDCANASFPCTSGVYGYLGYPTAWLLAQLQGDPAARAAFTPGSGEFYRSNPHWTNQIGAIAK